MKRLICLAVVLFTSTADLHAVVIPTVPVGNAGNAPYIEFSTRLGDVPYDYRIGTTEVTVAQYCAFLNAVAQIDVYGLYSTAMTTDPQSSGILRTLTPADGYVYTPISSPNMPVNLVSWSNAVRFANWMHNGQPSGRQNDSTTEDGAYALHGAASDAALLAIVREPDAKWWIPSESEWFKAAYHKNDGVTANYWSYPMQNDDVPASDQPPGADAPQPSNAGNFLADDGLANGFNDGFAVSGSLTRTNLQKYVTEVGAYVDAIGPYGTFDQGGNLNEWTEGKSLSGRSLRGGHWDREAEMLYRTSSTIAPPTLKRTSFGFRLATLPVPEPSTYALAAIGLTALFAIKRRKR